MPRFGGPVFSSTSSRKTNFTNLSNMSRIREGRTWKFHCNLYIKCQDLVVQFSVVLRVGKLSLVRSLNNMSRIREGRTWRFHYNLYIIM